MYKINLKSEKLDYDYDYESEIALFNSFNKIGVDLNCKKCKYGCMQTNVKYLSIMLIKW